MQQAKVLKEQVDVARHKETVLKARLQLWIHEAYIIIAPIEERMMQMQEIEEQAQGGSLATTVSKQHVQEIQQATPQCAANLAVTQVELGSLRAKISALIE